MLISCRGNLRDVAGSYPLEFSHFHEHLLVDQAADVVVQLHPDGLGEAHPDVLGDEVVVSLQSRHQYQIVQIVVDTSLNK